MRVRRSASPRSRSPPTQRDPRSPITPAIPDAPSRSATPDWAVCLRSCGRIDLRHDGRETELPRDCWTQWCFRLATGRAERRLQVPAHSSATTPLDVRASASDCAKHFTGVAGIGHGAGVDRDHSWADTCGGAAHEWLWTMHDSCTFTWFSVAQRLYSFARSASPHFTHRCTSMPKIPSEPLKLKRNFHTGTSSGDVHLVQSASKRSVRPSQPNATSASLWLRRSYAPFPLLLVYAFVCLLVRSVGPAGLLQNAPTADRKPC